TWSVPTWNVQKSLNSTTSYTCSTNQALTRASPAEHPPSALKLNNLPEPNRIDRKFPAASLFALGAHLFFHWLGCRRPPDAKIIQLLTRLEGRRKPSRFQ